MAQDESIISEIYDLVVAPDEYDAFMVGLEEKLVRLRQSGDTETARSLTQHMQRASALVDVVTPWQRETDATLHKELTKRLQVTIAGNGCAGPTRQCAGCKYSGDDRL